MKTITLFVSVIAILVCVSSAHAYAPQGSHGGIGLSAGGTSGFGLTYRQEFIGSPVGFQLTGFPIVLEQDEVVKGVVSGGLGLFITVHRPHWGRVFVSTGASALWAFNGGLGPVAKGDDFLMYSVGLGAGVELLFTGKVGLTLELPVGAYFDETGLAMVLPIPNVSLLYRW